MKNLTKLFALCVYISENCEADVFFSYSPHVDWVSVSVHRNGYTEGESATTDARVKINIPDADEKIDELMADLKELI